MARRNREINIFNMSLLDILCGALGAFCFMMLVVLPYYKPAGSAIDLQREEAQTESLLIQINKLRQAGSVSIVTAQMDDALRKLEEQIRRLEGQVNQLSSENQQLKTTNDDLTQKNQKQTQQLNARNPFFVYAAANDASQSIDVYVQDDVVQGGKTNPPFNPTGPHQSHFWNGDIDLTVPGRGIALWGIRDSPVNVHYKLYAKLANEPAQRRQTGIFSAAYGANYTLNFPELTLSPDRFWTFIGTLSSDPQGNGTVTFKEATQAERDAEWTKLSKGAPPPPSLPQASPKQIGPGGIAPERQRVLEEIEKLRRQRSQSSPSVSPAASP